MNTQQLTEVRNIARNEWIKHRDEGDAIAAAKIAAAVLVGSKDLALAYEIVNDTILHWSERNIVTPDTTPDQYEPNWSDEINSDKH